MPSCHGPMPPASRPHNELIRYYPVSSRHGSSISISSLQLENQWGVDGAYEATATSFGCDHALAEGAACGRRRSERQKTACNAESRHQERDRTFLDEPSSRGRRGREVAEVESSPSPGRPGPKPRPVSHKPDPLFEANEDPSSFADALAYQMRRFGESYWQLHRAVVRISFTSVCLACFRLGIVSSLKSRGENARSALTKFDLNPPRKLSATLRNHCPGLTEITVRDLLKSVSRTL